MLAAPIAGGENVDAILALKLRADVRGVPACGFGIEGTDFVPRSPRLFGLKEIPHSMEAGVLDFAATGRVVPADHEISAVLAQVDGARHSDF